MGKDQQRILELHSLLSKLLDTLSFEVCVHRRDENSVSLLQILLWRRKGDVDHQEFLELYRSWLQSKSIFDLFTCKQVQVYPKHELLSLELVQQNFMTVSHMNKSLEMLNEAYNKFYLEKKPNNLQQLEQAERIFSYLDTQGYIHLRMSSIFFFTGAALILEKYTVPINYEAFRIHMGDMRKQACEVNGMISLRGFKNYMLNLNSGKRANYLDNILGIFSEIESAIGGDRSSLPNLFEDLFHKWKSFPRFNSTDSRKSLEIYRRVFEENQRVFFDEGASIEYFLLNYGEQFVKCFQIDSSILREFNVLLKETLNKYIEIFTKVSQKIHQKPDKGNNSSMMTHRKKQGSDLQHPKMGSKMASMKERDRTPTKSHRNMQSRNNVSMQFNRTPNKATMNETKIRKEFGSAQKSKEKSFVGRQLTPTKSFREKGLTQSQAYSGVPQKSAIKVGVDKDSFYNRMLFFRNKRVESYEIVMKRLKGK